MNKGPKFVGISNMSYATFGRGLLLRFTRDIGTEIHRWTYQEDEKHVVYRYYFKLIGHQALEKLLRVVNKYQGKIRMYPEEYFTVVELRIMKVDIKDYTNRKNR